MPTHQTEGMHPGEFLLTEDGSTSLLNREAIRVANGQNLVAGAVLGQVTADSTYAEYDPVAVDGTETAVAILIYAVDASAGEADGVAVVRGPMGYKKAQVTFKTAMVQNDIDAGHASLLGLGIVGRDSDPVDMP